MNKEKLKQAIAKGNIEGGRIYAENAIREKNQALNFLRLASRIDAVASRLETAIRMQQVSAAMGQTVKGMANVMASMETTKISQTMDQFEKQFEDMDVKRYYQTLVTMTMKYMHAYIHMYIYTYIHIHIKIYIFLYVYICVHTYIHTHIYTMHKKRHEYLKFI